MNALADTLYFITLPIVLAAVAIGLALSLLSKNKYKTHIACLIVAIACVYQGSTLIYKFSFVEAIDMHGLSNVQATNVALNDVLIASLFPAIFTALSLLLARTLKHREIFLPVPLSLVLAIACSWYYGTKNAENLDLKTNVQMQRTE